MKKLLIIQTDGTYFLEETFRVMEKFHTSFKEFDLTFLVRENSIQEIQANIFPMVRGVTTDSDTVLTNQYDLSVNLSMDEASWDYHGKIKSKQKLGFQMVDGQLLVPDLWSTYLLTVKANAPFLTFHLQDIYRNILGIKKASYPQTKTRMLKELVIGNFNPKFFTLDERDKLVKEIRTLHPNISIKNLIEVDVISDLSQTLYFGPANLEALRLCEAGATGLFLSSSFQGFNLLPYSGNHFMISTGGKSLTAAKLNPVVNSIFTQGKPSHDNDFSLYQVDHENLFGAYLKGINPNDGAYPFYQCHVVLWNFLLNLYEINLDITKCSLEQLELIRTNKQVLTKLIRLQDYAMSSVDTLYHEARAENSSAESIDGHLKNLADIDGVISKVAESHPLLRPFLDFYRVRRGQNDGVTLSEQIERSFLTYSEEHHALSALNELFSVTLRKNEVSI